MQEFTLNFEIFQGPLDLLLQLIEDKKLPINNISLAEVTDKYLDYLQKNKQIHKKEIAEYIMISATLILIKSISLLPKLEISEEEKSDIEELKKRIFIYKKFKEIALDLEKMWNKQVIFNPQIKRSEISFLPTEDLTLENLKENLNNLIKNFPKIIKRPKVIVKKTISLAEAIKHLENRINSVLSLNFNELSKNDEGDRLGTIINFLSLLELVKRGLVKVKQKKPFEDIRMQKVDLSPLLRNTII